MGKRGRGRTMNSIGAHLLRVMAATLIVCAIAGGTYSATAHASTCATFTADSGDNVIILGETTSYFWYDGKYWFYGTGDLAVCWKNTYGVYTYTSYSSCDQNTSANDTVYVKALAGDDVVVPNVEGHNCEGSAISTYVNPFNEAIFDFGLSADMGTGADTAYGTDNDDDLYSNKPGTIIPYNYLPRDYAEDFLCGYDGDDSLYGDHDDTNTYEEILHGGNGTDYCNGGQDGSWFDWAHTTCNTSVYASAFSVDTTCGSNPPNLWW